MKKTIGFIGGGRITKIFLQALTQSKQLPDKVLVYDPNEEPLKSLKSIYPGFHEVESAKDAANADILILAVHPPVFGELLPALGAHVSPETLVLSLAPKITIEKISAALKTDRVVRMIPNATSFVNRGYNPVSFHEGFDEKEKKEFYTFFSSLGKNFETNENKLEGFAIISAMLPTYFWFQWKEMEKIALETGFSADEARVVISNTLDEALHIFYHSGLDQNEVIDLIPVKPIGNHEEEIRTILSTNLLGLYNKIKP